MTERIPIAVVGCGYWGAKHIRVLSESPSANLVMAVDARADRISRIQDRYRGVAVSRSVTDALSSDVAGIVIATPISTHYALAMAALEAGKHVLVEKPMAMKASECRRLIAIAERRHLTLMVGHTFEYHPAVDYMRQAVKRGDLGEIYDVSTRRLNLGLYQADTNVLWDLAPHDLSVIFRVIDSPLVDVSARGCAHVIPGVEDIVHVHLAFQNAARAHLHLSWLDPVKTRQITIVGSESMLVFDDMNSCDKIRTYDRRFKPTPQGDTFADFETAYHDGDVHIPSLSNQEPLQRELRDFIDAIATSKRPLADGYSGLHVVEALEECSRALANDGVGSAPSWSVAEWQRRNGQIRAVPDRSH
ncbi:Gfo/Idh/MocA family oxidoreductase [Alsobacter sp. KACC 23698]|uniref:Gfo/Idh/MocA family oxidoreductase n=1 Tax=Alsobacter sp. KACC 23698 TaxID=3149229 RepID=A0AAU7JII2_9HYPH